MEGTDIRKLSNAIEEFTRERVPNGEDLLLKAERRLLFLEISLGNTGSSNIIKPWCVRACVRACVCECACVRA